MGDPERIALHLWAVSHGTVSLELAGGLPDEPGAAERIYEEAMVMASCRSCARASHFGPFGR